MRKRGVGKRSASSVNEPSVDNCVEMTSPLCIDKALKDGPKMGDTMNCQDWDSSVSRCSVGVDDLNGWPRFRQMENCKL